MIPPTDLRMLHAATPGPTPASSFFAQVNNLHRSASLSEAPSDDASDNETSDVKRARSLRLPGQHAGPSRRDMSGLPSFGVVGSNLSSPAMSTISNYTPPPASRHPLFAHHAIPLSTSPTFTSDPGPSAPTTPSEASGSAFSPASAFLSHFSSSSSIRAPAPALAPDAQGARVLDYTLDKVVGRGGFSTVRKATHVVTGDTVACKIVKRDDLSDRSGSLERFEQEITTWKNLPPHPSLLPLLNMHRTPTHTFLIMPYLSGGSLLDVLKREGGSEKTAAKWFPGVVKAVSAMHEGYEGFSGGMLHGDLKLDNFLVDHHGNVVVCDFYMTQIIDKPVAHTVPPPMAKTRLHGQSSRQPSPHASKSRSPQYEPLPTQPFPSASLPYAPPELLRAPPSPTSLAQDVWAVGIILHALLTGRLPFVDQFDPRLQMKILRGQWEVPKWIGRGWIEVMEGCLEGRVEKRWDIKRIRESDAVIGWKDVQSRSRSRSRVRGRSDSRLHRELLEPRHADTTSPVAIRTPRRAVSREPRRLDPFSLPEARSRSASVSGSRSRSSGKGNTVFGFSPDATAESMTKLENIAIDRGRGRSTAQRFERDASSLTFTRPSSLNSRATSASRPPITAPPHLDTLNSSSRDQSRRRDQREQRESDSPGPKLAQMEHLHLGSQTPTKSRARSRSRNSPKGDYGTYEYRGELGVVDEEGMTRGRMGRDGLVPGSARGGRSRSRKRLD